MTDQPLSEKIEIQNNTSYIWIGDVKQAIQKTLKEENDFKITSNDVLDMDKDNLDFCRGVAFALKLAREYRNTTFKKHFGGLAE